MKTEAKRVALVVPDKDTAKAIPRRSCASVISASDAKRLKQWENVLLLVSWAQLESVKAFIKEANEWGNLRGILLDVEDQHEQDLLPIYLNHVRIRNLRNLMVHEGPEVPNRVINAYCIGAQQELIADAVVIDDELFVVSCSAESYKISFENIPSIHKIPAKHRGEFEIASDGSHIAWPAYDIHLDLESIRCATDDEYRLRSELRSLSRRRRFGMAVAKLRKDHNLRQSDFRGLSERQVRRIEHGEPSSLATFRLLAETHGMTVNEYLSAIAETISSTANQSVDSRTSMAKSKVTRKKAATSASKTLTSKATGKKSKAAAGSALSQRKAPKKTTSTRAASSASKVLRDKRTGKSSKSAAGSALSQKTRKSARTKRR